MRRIKCAISLMFIMAVVVMNLGYAVNADGNGVNAVNSENGVNAVNSENGVNGGTDGPGTSEFYDDAVRRYVEEFTKDTKCSSVSVAVYRSGKGGHNIGSTENGGAAGDISFYGNSAGLYQIGSMTKAFTGLAIQKLISEGKIDEDSAVSEYLQGFTANYNSQPYEITIGHLLSQTSGFSNNESLYPGASMDMSLQEWAESISGKELQSIPGESYSYSNANFNLLGAVIERVTERSYKDYMEQEILIPLGLMNTYVVKDLNDGDVIHGSRLGYRQAFQYDIPVAEGRIPAGYFYSNAEDMARWMKIWLGEEDIEAWGADIEEDIEADDAADVAADVAADIPDEFKVIINEVKARLREEGDYYSGWEVFGDGVIGHSGGTPNYSSRIVFSEEEKTGVCVLTNLNVAATTDSLCNGIFSCAVGERAGNTLTGDTVTDVWTVFDIIFSIVTASGVLAAVFAICTKKRNALLITGILISLLVISTCIVMPLIFGAGLGDIMLIWAPYSFSGALMLLITDIVLCFALWVIRKNANRKKAG